MDAELDLYDSQLDLDLTDDIDLETPLKSDAVENLKISIGNEPGTAPDPSVTFIKMESEDDDCIEVAPSESEPKVQCTINSKLTQVTVG